MPAEVLSQDDLLARLTEFVGEDEARATALGKAILRTDALRPIALVLKKRGAAEQQGAVHEQKARVGELEAQLALVTEQLEEKDAALQQLQSAQPDFARRMRDVEERYQKRVRELEEANVAEKGKRRGSTLQHHRDRLLTMLLPHLADEDYARYTALPKYQQFLDLDNDDNLIVKEPDEGVPYDPAKGDVLKQLVADAIEAIPSKYRAIPQAEGGGGAPPRPAGPQRPKTVEEIKETRRKSGLYAM